MSAQDRCGVGHAAADEQAEKRQEERGRRLKTAGVASKEKNNC